MATRGSRLHSLPFGAVQRPFCIQEKPNEVSTLRKHFVFAGAEGAAIFPSAKPIARRDCAVAPVQLPRRTQQARCDSPAARSAQGSAGPAATSLRGANAGEFKSYTSARTDVGFCPALRFLR